MDEEIGASRGRTRHVTRRALLGGFAATVGATLLAACSGGSAIGAATASGSAPGGTMTAAGSATTGRATTAAGSAAATARPAGTTAAGTMTTIGTTTAGTATMEKTGTVASGSAVVGTPMTPSASQVLNRTFTSTALRREMPCFIYLPVGYAESGLRYPVLYMLHGSGGSNTEWIGYGLLATADKMINAGQIAPMIIALPQGDQAFWVNHANDGQRWGDYTAQDVVQYIDTTYRTIPDTKHRAIGGLSMGADGAMQLAMNYPGVFGTTGIHSPTPRDYQATVAYVPFFGDEAYFNAHDPEHLVQQYPDRALALQLWLDDGADDTVWHTSVVAYDNLLTQLSIPHTWHGDWPGNHDGYYWGAHTADYLHFYDAALANG